MTTTQPGRSFVTARDGGERLSAQALLPATDADAALPRCYVNPLCRCQAIEAVLRDCFDAVESHGHTLRRVHTGSCDFALGNYTHLDTPGDVEFGCLSSARRKAGLTTAPGHWANAMRAR